MVDILNLDKEPLQKYDKYTKDLDIVFAEQFKKFLLDIESNKQYNGLLNILKCMTQGIIVPSVTYLTKLFLSAKYNFLDGGNVWKFVIELTENHIVITSKRWERSSPEAFNFHWSLKMKLERDASKMVSTELSIKKIKFIREDITEHQKKSIMDTIQEIYKPDN